MQRRRLQIRQRSELSHVRRLVLKIGSSLLTDPQTGVNQATIERVVAQVCQLRQRGVAVCLVSSGAVSLGRVTLARHRPAWLTRPLRVHEKQAAAAIGQPALMQAYHQAFARKHIDVAQMLLTRDDLRHRRRYLNASNTAETLFAADVVPIVNENDTVVVAEIKFGDNDALAALAARVIDADLVVLATDVDGLYDGPPNASDSRRISEVPRIDERIRQMAGGSGSAFGTGGMASKINAADIATRAGTALAIIAGNDDRALDALLDGEDVGTVFWCHDDRHNRRQHWIAELLTAEGVLFVDAGAEQAMCQRHASLLPIGLTAVQGSFDKGECVEIRNTRQQLIAKGLVNYNHHELASIQGLDSEAIQQKLGYLDYPEVVHRDNLVILRR